MPLTSKASILALQDLGEPIRFHVPEWDKGTPAEDGIVFLRRPTANDRDSWEIYCQDHAKKPKSIWRAKLASMLLCDEAGKLLFSQAEIEKLGEKSAAALNRIWKRGLELMTISDEEVAELEKNSESQPGN
jgi:hypothetical protein